jgi:hypothetical protein
MRRALKEKLFRPNGPDGTRRPNWQKTLMKKDGIQIRFRGVGADGRIRTGDPLFTKQLLYQLSYVGVRPDYMYAPTLPSPVNGGGEIML